MRFHLVLLSGVLMGSVGAAALGGTTQLVTNGSFEQSAVAAGTYTVVPAIPGWTSSAGIEVQTNNVQGAGQVTPFGSQFVELNVLGPSTLSQTLTTVPGEHYTLSFNMSARPGTGSNSVIVGITGNPSATFTATDTGSLDFQQFTESFIAASNASVLSFAPTGQFVSPNLGDDLDNVSVTGSSTAVAGVPLPSAASAGMVGLLSLGLIAAARRMRRRLA